MTTWQQQLLIEISMCTRRQLKEMFAEMLDNRKPEEVEELLKTLNNNNDSGNAALLVAMKTIRRYNAQEDKYVLGTHAKELAARPGMELVGAVDKAYNKSKTIYFEDSVAQAHINGKGWIIEDGLEIHKKRIKEAKKQEERWLANNLTPTFVVDDKRKQAIVQRAKERVLAVSAPYDKEAVEKYFSQKELAVSTAEYLQLLRSTETFDEALFQTLADGYEERRRIVALGRSGKWYEDKAKENFKAEGTTEKELLSMDVKTSRYPYREKQVFLKAFLDGERVRFAVFVREPKGREERTSTCSWTLEPIPEMLNKQVDKIRRRRRLPEDPVAFTIRDFDRAFRVWY